MNFTAATRLFGETEMTDEITTLVLEDEPAIDWEARDAARAELKDRESTAACYSHDNTDRGWEAFKAARSGTVATAAAANIGVTAAEKAEKQAKAKLDAARENHAAAAGRLDDAQAAARVAEKAFETNGQNSWPALKAARDLGEMHDALVAGTERALAAAQAEHTAAVNVADRERHRAKIEAATVQFDAAVKAATEAFALVLAQVRIASKLHDLSPSFHINTFATRLRNGVVALGHNQIGAKHGAVSEIDLFKSILAGVV